MYELTEEAESYYQDIKLDLESVVQEFNNTYNESAVLQEPLRIRVSNKGNCNTINVSFYLDIDGTKLRFRVEYEDDTTTNELSMVGSWFTVDSIVKKYKMQGGSVFASTYIKAAEEDEDPFADMGFDDEDPAGDVEPPIGDDQDPEDTIDDLSDTLDDLSDSLDDFEEDNVDIEMDNNIADHLIAECDKCHNIFITSVIQSDQEIEKISGTCPICDEESDQYIKWVVKEL